jgi:hypothetical protein
MPLPPASPLVLSKTDRKELLGLGRQRSIARGILLRVNIVLGAAEVELGLGSVQAERIALQRLLIEVDPCGLRGYGGHDCGESRERDVIHLLFLCLFDFVQVA